MTTADAYYDVPDGTELTDREEAQAETAVAAIERIRDDLPDGLWAFVREHFVFMP